jgi:hypothetical protein
MCAHARVLIRRSRAACWHQLLRRACAHCTHPPTAVLARQEQHACPPAVTTCSCTSTAFCVSTALEARPAAGASKTQARLGEAQRGRTAWGLRSASLLFLLPNIVLIRTRGALVRGASESTSRGALTPSRCAT